MQDRRPEVSLSWKECQKLQVLEEVRSGQRTQVSAGRALGITDRWVRTLLGRLRREGARGLVHGNRGRISERRLSEGRREGIVRLYREKYEEFNLTHFREMLGEREGMQKVPCREVLRRILREAGVWNRRREAPRHRLRRPRREREGELLQVDASIHRWLGEDKPEIALVGGIDDATGQVPVVRFCEAETTEAYFRVLAELAQKEGLPQAIYSDRDSVFIVNKKHELEVLRAQGKAPLTQFGRALKELGIEWIPAYSPQAKGRIERLWGTFQDRLLKEMRLEGIQTLAQANEYVRRRFLPRYNRKFAQPAAHPESVYRPAPVWRELEQILCWKETRVLGSDHTFSLGGQIWQVLASDQVPALRGRRIEVRRLLRGSLQAWYGSWPLKIRPASRAVVSACLEAGSQQRAAVPEDYPRRGRLRF